MKKIILLILVCLSFSCKHKPATDSIDNGIEQETTKAEDTATVDKVPENTELPEFTPLRAVVLPLIVLSSMIRLPLIVKVPLIDEFPILKLLSPPLILPQIWLFVISDLVSLLPALILMRALLLPTLIFLTRI